MSSNKLTSQELSEIKKYIKKQSKKLKSEGSTTAGVPGFQTPAAFSGEEGGDGTEKVDLTQGQFAYSIKAPKKKIHFVKLHEVSYKAFKEDTNTNEVQKINNKILEVNKMLREISRALDHSIKLKQESSLDNTKYWKRTNEAILKINTRLAEVSKKARKLANLKEITGNNIKAKLESLLKQANIPFEHIDYRSTGSDMFELDLWVSGEPYGIDYDRGVLTYQAPDKEVVLGNFDQEEEVIKNLTQIFKA